MKFWVSELLCQQALTPTCKKGGTQDLYSPEYTKEASCILKSVFSAGALVPQFKFSSPVLCSQFLGLQSLGRVYCCLKYSSPVPPSVPAVALLVQLSQFSATTSQFMFNPFSQIFEFESSVLSTLFIWVQLLSKSIFRFKFLNSNSEFWFIITILKSTPKEVSVDICITTILKFIISQIFEKGNQRFLHLRIYILSLSHHNFCSLTKASSTMHFPNE